MFANMRWDAWEFFGLVGEGLFFARLLAQWIASEREKRPVIPVVYWYMSLIGAVILIAYALHLGSFAVLLPQVVGIFFYGRGLQLEHTSRRIRERRHELGLDRSDYPWPELAIIIPVHNEEKQLAQTLNNLTEQDYPGRRRIIAALNGCTDGSRAIAERYPAVTIVEDEKAGMSFGKNLGVRAADPESVLVFIDADTVLPPNSLRLLAEAIAGKQHYIGTVAGKPDMGGGVVRICFRIANHATKRKRAHAPGGVMIMDRATFDRIGGFDEKLPQGTSTDCIWRALRTGAEYVFIDSFRAITSIRRFEKIGIIRQMLDWRKNHQALQADNKEEVVDKSYEDIR